MADKVEEIVETVSVVEVVARGPQGPTGLSIPTEIVEEFPLTPVTGTLYIQVLP